LLGIPPSAATDVCGALVKLAEPDLSPSDFCTKMVCGKIPHVGSLVLWNPVCGKIVEGLALEVSQPGHAWGLIIIIVAVAFVVAGGAYCFCSSRSSHRPDEKAALAFAGSVQQPPSGGIYQKQGAASAY
jgi:hypothetical protein